MAVIRQQNILGQQRIDVPHLRAIESGVAADFDLLAGQIMAGKRPMVVKGFNVITTGATGALASTLQINVAGGTIIHHEASEAGSIFSVPADRAAEVLTSTNPVVTGAFTPNQVNYIGLDLRRSADASTSDLVQFRDAGSDREIPKTVPLARTLNYRLTITTTDFSSNPNILPLAKVTTDSANNVTLIEDARNLLYRLGTGGDAPNRFYAYPWPGTRYENLTGDTFIGGDKGIGSLKDWQDATMTRLWEIGGGEHWYSATADRNVTMIESGAAFSNGEHFEWDGTNLHWKGLKFVFDNSTGYVNEIADQATDSTGLTNLADGECLYVDLDRTQNRTGVNALVVQRTALTTMGASAVPGSRHIIATRIGTSVYTKNWRFAVGAAFSPATTTSLGLVKLHATPGSALQPTVLVLDANGAVSLVATGGNATALQGTGNGSGAGVYGIGGATNGIGVRGLGGGTSGNGVTGLGADSTTGIAGNGIVGTGGASTSGGAGGIGVHGIGGTSTNLANVGVGVMGESTYGIGVVGESQNDYGVFGQSDNEHGVFGLTSGATASDAGVAGEAGAGTAAGVYGRSFGSGAGVRAWDSGSGVALEVQQGHAKFTGGNPTYNTAHTNMQTPMNLVKAWATIRVTGVSGTSATVEVLDGFNISAADDTSSSNIQVTFASAFANVNYCIMANTSSNGVIAVGASSTVSVCNVQAYNAASTAAVNFYTNAQVIVLYVMVMGAQS